MKITAHHANDNRHTLKNTTNLINEVYVDAETGFDDFCVCTYEIVMSKEKLMKVIAIYDKVKVTPKEGVSIYWPIQPYEEEFNLDASLKIIQKLAGKP